MRHRSLLFFLFATLTVAESIPGDFDGDGCIWLADLQIFCEDWLSSTPATPAVDMDGSGTVDLADFALFSATWRTGCANKPPVASDITLTCVQDRSVEIYLTGTDDMNRPLTYSITTQPQKGILGKRSNDHYIYYAGAESDGNEVLQYTAHDGQLESEPATITIQIAAPLRDTLYLKSGAVIIYDDTIQLDDSWTLCFWVRTLFDTGVIASKMDTAGVGFTLLLKEGKACLYLNDRNGSVYHLQTATQLNNGQWAMIAITHRAIGEIIANPENEYEETATTGLFVHNWINDSYDFAALPNLDIANNADLFYAGGYGNWFWPGQIDGVSFYGSGLSSFEVVLVLIEGRILKSHALSPAFTSRYPVNEGSGSVIYSTDMQHTGIAQPFFEWAPEDHRIFQAGDLRRKRGVFGNYMLERR